uniref:Fibrous sheath-interacting protein 1 n=1 Tax=Salvator merianae TaxID=96440 RepID=A0A8D0CAW5_SALMN
MDITRGSLDEISRPASTSRINHGSKVFSTSLEILTPEPDQSKVDFYNNHPENNVNDDYNENGEERTRKLDTSREKSEHNGFQLVIHNSSQIKEYSSSSADSEGDYAENKLSNCSNLSLGELDSFPRDSSTCQQDSKEKESDPRILKAIKKMKRLDQILANKQSQERAIKRQGREMRTKLWEEFQSMTSRNSSVITEEVENTQRFLALTSSVPEVPNPSTSEEDELPVSVFHTQIHPENYEHKTHGKQGSMTEARTKNSVKKMGNVHQKNEASYKKPPDFVKKNIELAKDSMNPVVMLEEEKKRLSELLKDTSAEGSELQVIEEEETGWLIPGEGYTPEPVEYHHLTEIDAKLKVVISDGNLSAVQDMFSKVPEQIYQESLAYANRKLEVNPGEKVLRDTKEERDQQNRLKEIDQQLENLEKTPDVLPCLYEEQLNALLEECLQTPRKGNSVTLPKSQEGFFLDGVSPSCTTSEDIILDSRNELTDCIQSMRMPTSQEMVGAGDKDICSKEVTDTSDYNLYQSHSLIESSLLEKNESGNQEEMAHASNFESYFMSLALSTDRPKKPSFLDEPFYCISMNVELSTDVNIPSVPMKTAEVELRDGDVNEE